MWRIMIESQKGAEFGISTIKPQEAVWLSTIQLILSIFGVLLTKGYLTIQKCYYPIFKPFWGANNQACSRLYGMYFLDFNTTYNRPGETFSNQVGTSLFGGQCNVGIICHFDWILGLALMCLPKVTRGESPLHWTVPICSARTMKMRGMHVR